VQEIRRFISNSILFNQKIADQLGLNSTDFQVLGLLDLHGSIKPAELARLTGLTTGGGTVALDRLEKAGYVRRERDTQDRRSIFVRSVPERIAAHQAHYKPVIQSLQKLSSEFSAAELKIIVEFFKRSNASG